MHRQIDFLVDLDAAHEELRLPTVSPCQVRAPLLRRAGFAQVHSFSSVSRSAQSTAMVDANGRSVVVEGDLEARESETGEAGSWEG